MDAQQIKGVLAEKLNRPLNVVNISPATGGSINDCYIVELADEKSLFIKGHRNSIIPGMYRAEFKALQLLGSTDVICVPRPVFCDEECLVLEAFQSGKPALQWQEKMGQALALLHRATRGERFGFPCDNYLGTTLQNNTWQDDWLSFWRNQRLAYQFTIFSKHVGADDPLLKAGDKLLDHLDDVLLGEKEPAVLVHGDLWSGNASANEKGEPVIFDPASYYGHREAEFGMMRLFGGFGAECEAAYQEVWPLQSGFDRRIEVYRLYHQLNHLNLFGSAYYDGCLASIRNIL